MYKRKRSNSSYNNRPFKRPRTTTPVSTIVKKEIRKQEEKQYFNISSGPSSIDIGGTMFNLLFNMNKGDNDDQYSGSRVTPQWLRVRYAINSTQSAFSMVRIIIFQWKSQSAPIPADVLTLIGNARAPLSSTVSRFKATARILHDKLHDINAIAPATVTTVYSTQAFMKKIQPIEFFESANGVSSNGLYLFAISDDGVTDFPDLQFVSELCYSD